MASVAAVASMQLLPPAPQQTQLQLACSHSEVGACQLLPAARTHNLLDKLEWGPGCAGALSCKPRLKLEFVITRHCPAAVSGGITSVAAPQDAQHCIHHHLHVGTLSINRL